MRQEISWPELRVDTDFEAFPGLHLDWSQVSLTRVSLQDVGLCWTFYVDLAIEECSLAPTHVLLVSVGLQRDQNLLLNRACQGERVDVVVEEGVAEDAGLLPGFVVC